MFERLFGWFRASSKTEERRSGCGCPPPTHPRELPGFQSQVEKHLERWWGMKIERPNSHIPTLAPDQFGRDVGATKQHQQQSRRAPRNKWED